MTNEQTAVETNETPFAEGVFLKERFEIRFDIPLPELDTNGAKAYEVKDNINPERNLFALVCGSETSPRLSYLPYMKSIDSPYILKLIEYGSIQIKDNPETIVLIYNKPTGPRADSTDLKERPSADVFKTLALSLLSACDVLKTFNLTHRAIRLDNMFYKDSSRTELVVGDCLACFPSYYQPDVYETIENLLCSPYSRGNGLSEHDLYACGVTLLQLALNKKISFELSTEEIIRQKLKNSSFLFLSENEKLHPHVSSILRSLLDDTSENRCTYSHLLNFYEGKTQTLIPIDTVEKSNRTLIVNNEKCYTRKTAALAMLMNPDFGIEVIQSGKLLEWIKNGLENEKLYGKIEKIIIAEKENQDKRLLLGKICIFLECSLPLKCGDSYLFPDGLAKNIYFCKKNNLPLNHLQNLIMTDIVKIWY
ncbi:MAG: hypothetical protein MJ210_05545, partial [Alphaproteobacteria bacterium]|nr:hypothetical protein [Alphaproteobacteria bacterium]